MTTIDLNADLGEGCAGDDELLAIVSSCNVACGGHAGDRDSMETTVANAIANGVAVGAHPSYPDREGLGRRPGFLTGEPLYESLTEQVTNLADVAASLGAELRHVKPHGALYNDAVRDPALAKIVARVTAEAPNGPALVGQPDTELERAANEHGLEFIAEGFIDRAYEADGRLVSRSEPGAVYSDFNAITGQAVSLALDNVVTARNGEVIDVRADTLCIHGDTEGAAEAARAVRDVLEHRGIEIHAVGR